MSGSRFSIKRNFERIAYCMRYLSRYGWNAFVSHLHSELFPFREMTSVRRFFSSSTGKIRRQIEAASKVDIYLTFHRGGGASDYLARRLRAETGAISVVVRNTACAKWLYCEIWRERRIVSRFYAEGLATIGRLAGGKCRRIVVNELVSWNSYCGYATMTNGSLRSIYREITELAKESRGKLEYLVHDYFAICPQIIFHSEAEGYCGFGEDLERCRRCLAGGGAAASMVKAGTDVSVWRDASLAFLSACDEVRCFSADSEKRLRRIFPGLEKITVVPHEPLCRFDPVARNDGGRIVIGVVGALAPHKGLKEVEALAEYIGEKGLDAEIVIIGTVPDNSPLWKTAKVTGSYEHNRLARIIAEARVNMAFFSSVWPETFSYVTQELMMMRLPAVCFNLGAQAERIAGYEFGAIAESTSPQDVWRAITGLRARL